MENFLCKLFEQGFSVVAVFIHRFISVGIDNNPMIVLKLLWNKIQFIIEYAPKYDKLNEHFV